MKLAVYKTKITPIHPYTLKVTVLLREFTGQTLKMLSLFSAMRDDPLHSLCSHATLALHFLVFRDKLYICIYACILCMYFVYISFDDIAELLAGCIIQGSVHVSKVQHRTLTASTDLQHLLVSWDNQKYGSEIWKRSHTSYYVL